MRLDRLEDVAAEQQFLGEHVEEDGKSRPGQDRPRNGDPGPEGQATRDPNTGDREGQPGGSRDEAPDEIANDMADAEADRDERPAGDEPPPDPGGRPQR